jgi:hypothetical protein
MSDLSVLRFARKPSAGWAPAAGMFLGHYVAWICAALLLIYWVREHGVDPAQGKDPGTMVNDAVGWAGLLCVVIAGWTTANPTMYRAGLAFQLKDIIGTERIRRVEDDFLERAVTRFKDSPRIRILGDLEARRIGIVSLVFDEGRLHHNLAARLLSDRWGIQTRGGCMCAGTYGHDLLGISASRSFEIRCALDQGDEAAKPGWLRISFSPATTEEDFRVLLDAVSELPERWQEWASEYRIEQHTATWRHKDDDLDTKNRPLNLLPPVLEGL